MGGNAACRHAMLHPEKKSQLHGEMPLAEARKDKIVLVMCINIVVESNICYKMISRNQHIVVHILGVQKVRA